MVDQQNAAVDGIIGWSKMDEKIRLAHNEKVKNSQKPSIWEYNPKGGVPTELANLDPSTFSTSRLGQILCSLPKDILVRVCSMLSVSDFVHFSQTCRLLHWRMFSFCTCYAPHRVRMQICDDRAEMEELIYALNNNPIDYESNDDGAGHIINLGRATVIQPYRRELDSQRGLFIYQPFCLRKPFLFEVLELELILPAYCKQFYGKCLSCIVAVRGLARHLNIFFFKPTDVENHFINHPDTNDFLTTVNASFYSTIFVAHDDRDVYFSRNYNANIYINCPYARQMNRVYIIGNDAQNRLNVPVFQNRIGIYRFPLDSAILATLKNFLAGSTNLIFHQYLDIQGNNGRFPLLEYLFEEFGEFEESFLCDGIQPHFNFYAWKKVVVTENGEQLRIVIKKMYSFYSFITIGKEEMFDEMENKFANNSFYRWGNMMWKMETALEPDEAEESEEVKEPDVTEQPDEDSDGSEEEQGAGCRLSK